MHSTLSWFAALLVSIATGNVAAAGGSDDSEVLTAMLLQRAKEGDAEGLRALESKVEEARSPAVRHAYHVARYITDPEGYASQYVAEFPEDSDGVMGAVYQIELATGEDGQRLTPRFLYSFDELGKLAERGQRGAAKKLFVVAGNSDGVVTECVCEWVTKALLTQPARSVDELSSLPRAQRMKAYGCFHATSGSDLEAIRTATGGLPSGKHDEISREILEALQD